MSIVIDKDVDRAQHLKDLIEFMDAPQVQLANLNDWRAQVGDCRLDAVFVDNSLSDDEANQLIVDVGDLDPNVSIVFVNSTAVGT